MVVILGIAGISSGGGDNKKDLEALQGDWSVLSLKVAGQPDPPEALLKTLVVTFKGDEMILTASPGGKDTITDSMKIKLDSTKNPKTIDFTHLTGKDKGQTELGIYKIEGEMLTMCTNDDFTGGPRPDAFATKEGTKNQLLVLKKAKTGK
jgi:uncharacterized protein (TIGR03067 family)